MQRTSRSVVLATPCLVDGPEPRLDISSLAHIWFSPYNPAVPLLPWSPFPLLRLGQSHFPGKDTIGKDSAGLLSPECGEVEDLRRYAAVSLCLTPGLAFPFWPCTNPAPCLLSRKQLIQLPHNRVDNKRTKGELFVSERAGGGGYRPAVRYILV